MKKWVVLDLDGTLSDCSARQHLAQAKEWDAFHALCGEDRPNPDVVALIESANCPLRQGADENGKELQFMIVTGRPEKYRGVTEAWLKEWNIPVEKLIMRPDYDFTRSGPLKIRQLEEEFGVGEPLLDSIAFILEDRDAVIQAFRDYGLPCWQVRPGGY